MSKVTALAALSFAMVLTSVAATSCTAGEENPSSGASSGSSGSPASDASTTDSGGSTTSDAGMTDARTTDALPPLTNPPAWAANAPLNAWVEVPGTSGAGGTNIESYSGWAKMPNGKIAITLAGGHTDGDRNSTAVIDMLADAPAWVEVGAPSPTHTYETAYQPDGKPTCSHIYTSAMWVPSTNRLMRIGAKFVSMSGNTSFGTVDGFNFATNTWDPAGTYVSVATGQAGTAYRPADNKVLMQGAGYFYDPVSGAQTPITPTNQPLMPRFPWAWDSNRNQFFGIQVGDGQGYSLGVGLVATKIVGTTATPITIADSAAKTQFLSDAPIYAAMEYDPINDCFLFYFGYGAARGRVYKIVPNNTNVWDMSLFSYGAGGVTPVTTVGSGILNKFSYVPELRGIVMMTDKSSNLYFMRTA